MIRSSFFVIAKELLFVTHLTAAGPHSYNAITSPLSLILRRILHYPTFTQREESHHWCRKKLHIPYIHYRSPSFIHYVLRLFSLFLPFSRWSLLHLEIHLTLFTCPVPSLFFTLLPCRWSISRNTDSVLTHIILLNYNRTERLLPDGLNTRNRFSSFCWLRYVYRLLFFTFKSVCCISIIQEIVLYYTDHINVCGV